MGEFFSRLLDFIKELWPFRVVEPWEQGFYVTFSRPGRAVGPGIWPVVPYFQDVRSVSVAEARTSTPLLSVVLADGRRVSFSASARVLVVDPFAAIIAVQDYQQTTSEEISATMAEFFADADPTRFATARKRRNLLTEVTTLLNERLAPFGIKVQEVQLTNWIDGVRTYRLLNDSALAMPSLTW